MFADVGGGAVEGFESVETDVAEGLPSALRFNWRRRGKFHVQDAESPRVSQAWQICNLSAESDGQHQFATVRGRDREWNGFEGSPRPTVGDEQCFYERRGYPAIQHRREADYIPSWSRVTHRLSTITTSLPGLARVTSQGHAGLMSSRYLRVCRYDLPDSSGRDATSSTLRQWHCGRVSDVLSHIGPGSQQWKEALDRFRVFWCFAFQVPFRAPL